MQIIALKTPSGEILVSRANYNFVSSEDGKSFIDGGQGDYFRYAGGEIIRIELDVNLGQLYDDWNRRFDKYCSFDIKDVKIVPKDQWEDRESFEWKKKEATWGSRGKDGKGELVYKRLIELETEHLLAIWALPYVSTTTIEIIDSILEDRTFEQASPGSQGK